MTLSTSKSLLAKLMATENIIVEQRKVPTASFNTQTRVLTVPILDQDISSDLYDLMLGHEVAHALWTPMQMLLEGKKRKINHSILNVIEDARIERMIKNKYPGLRSAFSKGYRELMEKNFFEVEGMSLDELNFIDRANIHYKCGGFTPVKFTEEEQKYIKMIDEARTCEEILSAAEEIMKFMKEKASGQPGFYPTKPNEVPDQGKSGDWFDNDNREVKNDDEESEEEEKSSEDVEEDDTSDEDSEQTNNNDAAKPSIGSTKQPNADVEEEIRSRTDEALEKNREKLYSDDARTYRYVNIPDFDLSRCVVDHKKLWARYRKDVMEHLSTYFSNTKLDGTNRKEYLDIRRDAATAVSYLVKEFELKKNAEQSKKASVSKTGELDMNKIFNYQLTDDIFRRVTTIPGGKSHGLVITLDWSGSMTGNLKNTIKQLISLVMFCKKVCIPFEVYAFTSQYWDKESHLVGYTCERKAGDLITHQHNMLNIISSRMTNQEMTYAMSALLFTAGSSRLAPDWFSLGGTPLNEAVIALMKIVPKFQKEFKLQVVSTVILSDGDGHSLYDVYEANGSRSHERVSDIVFRDPVTKNEIKSRDYWGRANTAIYIKLLKLRAKCNVVGFYILSGREYGREIVHYHTGKTSDEIDEMKKNFRQNKYDIVTSSGFDEYYLLRAEGMDTDEPEFEVKEGATTKALATAFSKYAGNRLSNRVILNRFVNLIA